MSLQCQGHGLVFQSLGFGIVGRLFEESPDIAARSFEQALAICGFASCRGQQAADPEFNARDPRTLGPPQVAVFQPGPLRFHEIQRCPPCLVKVNRSQADQAMEMLGREAGAASLQSQPFRLQRNRDHLRQVDVQPAIRRFATIRTSRGLDQQFRITLVAWRSWPITMCAMVEELRGMVS